MSAMTTLRRTDEHNLRQAISEILEEIYAIEYAMGQFYRKGSERELARAVEDFELMRSAVDRLAALIESAHRGGAIEPKIAEQTT
jgi:hypothetical protein